MLMEMRGALQCFIGKNVKVCKQLLWEVIRGNARLGRQWTERKEVRLLVCLFFLKDTSQA